MHRTRPSTQTTDVALHWLPSGATQTGIGSPSSASSPLPVQVGMSSAGAYADGTHSGSALLHAAKRHVSTRTGNRMTGA